jgi:multiple sugar transport system substrate-binding protein
VRRTSRHLALLLLAVCALTVAACGGSGSDDGAGTGTSAGGGSGGGKVKISFLTHWAPETVTAFERVTAAYQADHPDVEIDIRAVPFADLLTTVRSQAGGDNGPTMASIYDLWLPELVRDGVLSRAPAANASEVADAWPANLASAASSDGSVYGYPNEVDLYALNYNKTLFRAAGIDAPPATWDELVADAKRLTRRDGDRITQQGFGLISSWAAGTVHPFASLLYSNGGELIADGRAALDSDQAGQAFDLVDQLANKEKVSSSQMSTADANTTGPYLENFVSGKTAMIVMANWWESALRAGMKGRFADIGTAPIPVGPGGDGPHSVSYSWMTVVNGKASAEQQAAAWEFLSYLNGPDSGRAGHSAMAALLQSMGILPSRTSDLEAYRGDLSRPFLKAYIEELPNAKPFPIVLGGQEFTESLQRNLEALQAGQMSAGDAQERSQADAQSVLETAAG